MVRTMARCMFICQWYDTGPNTFINIYIVLEKMRQVESDRWADSQQKQLLVGFQNWEFGLWTGPKIKYVMSNMYTVWGFTVVYWENRIKTQGKFVKCIKYAQILHGIAWKLYAGTILCDNYIYNVGQEINTLQFYNKYRIQFLQQFKSAK